VRRDRHVDVAHTERPQRIEHGVGDRRRRADDTPFLQVETIATASPNNFMGLKGVGELPTNGAPAAIANAVLDALRPLGVRHIDMPITAHKVWRALQATTMASAPRPAT